MTDARKSDYFFSQGWLAMPQLVLQALWQEVWHSPQPPLRRLLAISRVFRVWMCFIKQSPLLSLVSLIVHAGAGVCQGGAAGCGVARGVRGAGKPAGRFWQRERRGGVRGLPQRARRRKRKGHGDARCAPARQGWAGADAAGVKIMEMHQGRRPVYGGAPRNPPKIAANATTRGVQGSCGPLVGGRRIETAGRGA